MKRGQVSLFVIIAIFLVVAIAAFFFVFKETGISLTTRDKNFDPESFVDNCVRKEVRDYIEVALPQGGFANPTDFVSYNGTNIAYSCKNINFYEPCINQHPLYISSLENELEKGVQDNVESCFLQLEDELTARDFKFSGGNISIKTTLKPGIVEVNTLRDMTITRGDLTRNFDSFKTLIRSPFYDLAFVAQEITTQEASFCYFEYVGYMLLYDRFDIRKNTLDDSTKIYSIKDKESDKTMNIALRGCAIPPGF